MAANGRQCWTFGRSSSAGRAEKQGRREEPVADQWAMKSVMGREGTAGLLAGSRVRGNEQAASGGRTANREQRPWGLSARIPAK